MHRSGTSATAGLLGTLGLELPKTLMRPSDFNPAGYFESDRLADLNDEILRSLGGEWRQQRPLPVTDAVISRWSGQIAQAVSEEFSLSRSFVLKDPRVSLLLPLYRAALGGLGAAVRVVFVFRNPLSVLDSLRRRDRIDPEQAAGIWLRHNLDAERHCRGLPRLFLEYDAVLAQPEMTLAGLRQFLPDLEETSPRDSTFLAPELRHHWHRASELAGSGHRRVRLAYATMRQLAQSDSFASRRIMDALRLTWR